MLLTSILSLSVPPGEIVLRGTLVYLGVIALLRLAGRRQCGGVGTTDVLAIMFLADSVQNGLAGPQKTVLDVAPQ